jgi:hypothetical protein
MGHGTSEHLSLSGQASKVATLPAQGCEICGLGLQPPLTSFALSNPRRIFRCATSTPGLPDPPASHNKANGTPKFPARSRNSQGPSPVNGRNRAVHKVHRVAHRSYLSDVSEIDRPDVQSFEQLWPGSEFKPTHFDTERAEHFFEIAMSYRPSGKFLSQMFDRWSED